MKHYWQTLTSAIRRKSPRIPHSVTNAVSRSLPPHLRKSSKKTLLLKGFKVFILFGVVLGFIGAGALLLWASTLKMPSLEAVENRRVEQSTKIYDRTGEILLYDLHQDVKRTIIPFDEMSRNVKNATVAIEDDRFYEHFGIEPTAIVRAVLTNLKNGDLLGGQGGSTITQQVVKNSVLVRDKTISRKFKEWVLAIRLEQSLTKEEILELYLNEVPYGGNKYGIEEASQGFFGKPASDLSVAESAYLAALPQAPTYYSPYGNNRGALEDRKNLVLKRMYELGFITNDEYEVAQDEDIFFLPQKDTGIRAPHFVFYVIEQLEEMYSDRELVEAGFRVITSLDMELQAKAEEIVERHAKENAQKYNASNASLVATDPRSGEVLVMVGSRDYFDEEIDGNFNVALAHRQPGSSFKPFVYAQALDEGFTDQTIVFDVKTQFSTSCEPSNLTSEGSCYSPVNYDGVFRGPVTFRNALAQSMNIPAIKVLYLAGVNDALALAERMGITSLGNKNQYGLTLVLGGGEVSLLDMVGAYGVFAQEGIKEERKSILRIEDVNKVIVEDFSKKREQERVLDPNIARMITDILADNNARTPAFGANSFLNFPGRDVAAKTGTTNEYRDAWILGYTPSIAVGAWAGNNNNEPMDKRVAGFIIAPLWNEFLQEYFKQHNEVERFTRPQPLVHSGMKPILRGVWSGGQAYYIDRSTGKLADDSTLPQDRQEIVIGGNVHSILHYVTRGDPQGPAPSNPSQDGQYRYWEYGVSLWRGSTPSINDVVIPTDGDDDTGNTSSQRPDVNIIRPRENEEVEKDERVSINLRIRSKVPISQVDYFINDAHLTTETSEPFETTFTPEDVASIRDRNTLKIVVRDEQQNTTTIERVFRVE